LKSAPSLTLSKLSCIRGGRQLFKGVDCGLSAGQWLYVTGANGVGKTSLLRIICGLSPAESGEVLYQGTPIQKQLDAFHEALCYLGHHNALQESMSVAENLTFTSALANQTVARTRMLAVLERFGLKGRSQQLVRHLSQGQKRRVALSKLALSPARLWVLDEPYVAMDEAGIQMLASLIAEHLAGGGMAIITSHQRVAIGGIAPHILDLSAA
jgi:heme exporter protein A